MAMVHITTDKEGYFVAAYAYPRKGTTEVPAPLPDPVEGRLRLVDGKLIVVSDDAKTHEEIEAARAASYRATVDPITCEIARLRDMGGTAEEIAEAEARREAAVASVKEQHPYPDNS